MEILKSHFSTLIDMASVSCNHDEREDATCKYCLARDAIVVIGNIISKFEDRIEG
jgi:hypothetical protein